MIGAVAWSWKTFRSGPNLFPADSSVLLVTIDTLRPDALGFVSGLNETPVIDALARSGVRFSDAVTAVPLTLPSHATMLTGVLPIRHGVHVNGQALSASIPTLAEQFRAHGHATAAFVSATVLKKDFGLDRGFDVYDDADSLSDQRLMQRRAAQTFAVARDWIARQGDKPWFVWVHVYDAHTPYDPPRAFWQPGELGAYRGAVSYIDDALGPLLESARLAAPERLLTILTADHAEAFGEHDEIEHGIFIYDTTMRVPLVFSYPGILPASEPDFTPRLVDLSPTIVHGFGWASPLDYDGIDLGPGLRGAALDVPPAYIESEYPWTSFGWAPLHGVIDGDWKYVSAPRSELFGLETDRDELVNRVDTDVPQQARLTMWLDRARLAPPLATAAQVDNAEALARLQSLGYVGAGNNLGQAPEGRPDPKDTTNIRARLRDADGESRRGNIDAARRLFEEVLAEEPGNRFALSRLASIALDHADFELAISHAQASLALAPEQADMQFALADALTRSGRYAEALPHWLEAARLQPAKVEIWSNLGSTARWLGNHERALLAYREALALAPEDAAILGNLGEAERTAGMPAAAVEHLVAAARHEGPATHRAARIGVLYADLGRDNEAREWLAKSRAIDDDYADGQLRLAGLLVSTDPAAARAALARSCRADPGLAATAQANASLRAVVDACFSASR